MTAEQPTILDRKNLYQSKRFSILEDTVRIGEDKSIKYSYLDKKHAVGIIAINNSSVFLVEQYRHSIRERLLEIPGGSIEEGESPRQAALRELNEEIGYKALNLELLNVCYPLPSVSNEKIFTFYTEALEKDIHSRDISEQDMKLIVIPLKEISNLLKENKIASASDAFLLYSFLHTKHPSLLLPNHS